MTEEEYKKLKKEMYARHQREYRLLDRDFAFSNNKVKIGEFVTDHHQTIKVESIGFAGSAYGLPCCTYTGPRYTKSGKPFKNGEVSTVWQCNVGRERR